MSDMTFKACSLRWPAGIFTTPRMSLTVSGFRNGFVTSGPSRVVVCFLVSFVFGDFRVDILEVK